MKFWLLVCALLYSTLRGFGEGMTMHFPNVREHPLFAWYHLARILEALTCAGTACICYHNIAKLSKMVLFLSGVAFLSWESFELSYVLTRLGQANWHENILGFWPVDGTLPVILIHLARVLTGFGLFFFGRK